MGKTIAKTLCAVLVGALSWPLLLTAADRNPQAAMVLEESYQIGRHLQTQDRAFFLVRLCDISTSISPERTEAWCQELWDLVPSLPPDWNRVATAKNSLVPLARVNPVRAFELLSRVEKPIPEQGSLTEDVRADAAVIIFGKYFQASGVAELDNIVKKAEAIGKPGGEYPYRAMGLIIEELAKGHADDKTTSDIFNGALGYFRRGSDFQDEDEQFFELLQSARSIIPETTYKNGLKEFIKHLTSNKSNEPQGY